MDKINKYGWYYISPDIEIEDDYDDVQLIPISSGNNRFFSSVNILIYGGTVISQDVYNMQDDEDDTLILAMCSNDHKMVILKNPTNKYDYYDKYEGIKISVPNDKIVEIENKNGKLLMKIKDRRTEVE